MFCERCGQHFQPKESICARCKAAPTRHWLQLVSLATLAIAVILNTLSPVSLLPHGSGDHGFSMLQFWMRANDALSIYGWAIVTIGLLVWSFWLHGGYEVAKREWFARFVLILLLPSGIAVLRSQPIPSKFASEVRATIYSHPGLGPALAWAVIILVVGLLCANSETRDSLLGEGRTLSMVSLGVLLVVMVMALVGWSLGY